MISVENVQQAAKMIKGKVIRTPLVYSPSLSKIFEGENSPQAEKGGL